MQPAAATANPAVTPVLPLKSVALVRAVIPPAAVIALPETPPNPPFTSKAVARRVGRQVAITAYRRAKLWIQIC